jgi:hypothetical protein
MYNTPLVISFSTFCSGLRSRDRHSELGPAEVVPRATMTHW